MAKSSEISILPRGLRNNNPGNIRHDKDKWQGEVIPSTDKSFKQFENIYYGYRAMIKLLQNYSKLRGCKTLRQMVTRYAPPNENNTENYIKRVSKQTSINPDVEVNIYDKDEMCRIVAAMIFVENGIKANMEDIYKGWDLL